MASKATPKKTAAEKPAEKSAETDTPISADGEKITDDTTFVIGHDGKRYTSQAYAEADESRFGYDPERKAD